MEDISWRNLTYVTIYIRCNIFIVIFSVRDSCTRNSLAYWQVNKRSADLAALRIVQWGFKVILKISGVEVTVIGEDRVPNEPVLYVGNHRSYFDILLTYSRCRDLTGFVAKKEMLNYPFLRTWMKRVYCLFLDRDNIREGLKTILTAIDQVKNGISVFIFPEGTRNKGEELSLLPFHAGSFKIAEKSGCPIVPVALNNTINIFEGHLPYIKKTHVVLEYCSPIYMNEMEKEDRKKIDVYCQKIIKDTIEKNHTLV